jgi:hypothetical protein
MLTDVDDAATEELEEDNISLVSIDYDEAESPSSSQAGIFAGHLSESALSIAERDLMLLPTANAFVEDNENINERSLGTMDLRAYGIDYMEDANERSMSIQDIEMGCNSRSESQRFQQSGITATPQGASELSLSTAHIFEGEASLLLTKNNSSEDETGIGNQTKFLARCNDSLLLLHAEEAGSHEMNNRRWRKTRETRHVLSDVLLRVRAQGVRGKSLAEQIRGNRSDSTTISVDAAALKTREQYDPTTNLVWNN